MRKFAPLIFVLSSLLALVSFSSMAQASSAQELFWAKNWEGLMALDQKGLSPRELSLKAGAYWLQGRWEESLSLMETIKDSYPESLKAYFHMSRALALERTGRSKEAYGEALNLYLSNPPEDLKYYLSYSLSRLTGNPEEKRKWLRRMVSFSLDSSQKAPALSALMAFEDPSFSDAAEALKLNPKDKKALSIVEKAPESLERSYRLGVGYYLLGQDKRALSYLSKVPASGPFSQSSMYFRAMALYRQRKYEESLVFLTKLLFTEKGEYAERSAKRIAVIAGKGFRSRGSAILKRAQKEMKGKEGLYAASAYLGLLEGKERVLQEDFIVKNHPKTSQASSILRERAWKEWEKGIYDKAFGLFMEASKGPDGTFPESLYWAGRCLERSKGSDKKGEKSKDEMKQEVYSVLLREHPFSVYSFMASRDYRPEFSDEVGLKRKESELESWGFVKQSEIKLSKSQDPGELYNGAWIASWLGKTEKSYRTMRTLEKFIKTGEAVSLENAKLLYPRPFSKEVRKVKDAFGLEENLIWAVMRQESAFNPRAVSSAGASGLMQLMKKTAKWEADTLGMKKYDLFKVLDNIILGGAHLRRLQNSYCRLEWVLAAYNAGGGNVNKWNRTNLDLPTDLWIEAVPFKETRGYVKKVLGNLYVYRSLYGEPELTPARPETAPKPQSPSERTP